VTAPNNTSPHTTLLRQLGLVSATALVVSNMIGQGILTSSGFLAGQLGSPWLVMWIWVVGALCAFLGAVCYSELAVNQPGSGGEYVYLTNAYGPTWGFMTGFVSFFAGFSGPIAASALAFSGYLGYFFPAVKHENSQVFLGSGEWTLRFGGEQAAACALVLFFTVLNCLGVARTARIQNVLTMMKVLVLAAFVVLGFLIGNGSGSHFSMDAVRTETNSVAAQFAVSLFWIYVAYSGWNAATYVAEEIKDPSRNLPRALAIGTALVTVLYLSLNAVFIYGAPLEDLKNQEAVAAVAATHLFGPRVAGVFAALMAISLMSTVNAMVTIGPRVYFAMARNGAFVSAAARVHPRWRTPVFAILAQGICTMLMTLTPFPQLVVYIGFMLNLCAVMSVASLFWMRRKAGWKKLPAVSFAWPLVPSLFLLVGGWMIVRGVQLKPVISLISAITVGAGVAVYHFRQRTQRGVALET
jgi:APA family basic amino acid/polyamine antiporter